MTDANERIIPYKDINPDRFYTVKEIIEELNGCFIWLEKEKHSYRGYLDWIKKEYARDNEMNIKYMPNARVQYFIKGSDLLDYLEKYFLD